MPLQLFLNELSFPSGQVARAVSVDFLKVLVASVRQAHSVDNTLVLNSEMPLGSLPLGAGATIATIRNGGDCVEESLYLKTVNNRAPLALAAGEAGGRDPDLSEYTIYGGAPIFAGNTAVGLGFAHLLDGLCLSFGTHGFWSEQSLPLDLATLDAVGSILTEQVVARNADSADAVALHAEALLESLKPSIASGTELWERRAVLFPHLKFIPRTRAQIEVMLAGDPALHQAWIKLRGINQAIGVWKISGGPFPMFPFNVRPESSTRRKLAEFNDEQGNKQIFSEHCDLAPAEGRIHFIVKGKPDPYALIGHVGRKLGIG
jgi:hypothetical protein